MRQTFLSNKGSAIEVIMVIEVIMKGIDRYSRVWFEI